MKTKKAHGVVRIPTVPAVARTILVSGTAAQTLYEAGRCRLGRGKLLTLLTTGLLLLVVAGCGGGSGTTPPPTPTPTPTPNPSPAITTLSPASAAAGGAAFTLTVDGSNFVPASVVQWNGNGRTTTFVNASQITAQILASDIARAGKASVTVMSPAPGGGVSSPLAFSLLSTVMTFFSSRALDGSDAANTNNTDNVWVIHADGSSPAPLTRLTAFAANSTSAVWSPDGSKLAFASSRALDGSDADNINNTSNIWVMNADGSSPMPLTRLTAFAASSFSAVWSPDGSKLAFESERALDGSDAANTNNTQNIWVVNADGTGATPLTRLTVAGASSHAPVWSPDGAKLAYASGRALDGSNAPNTFSTANIWVMNADGSGALALTRLTSGPLSATPVWSPDGSKLAFGSSRALDGSDANNTNNTENIWVIHADGSSPTPLTRITALAGSSNSEVWSPDGNKVAFQSPRALDGSDALNTNSTFNIWVVNADGSGATPLTRLTASGAGNGVAAWSPDGGKLAFDSSRALDGSDAANTNGTFNIWVMNADGSAVTPLTRTTANAANSFTPRWRP